MITLKHKFSDLLICSLGFLQGYVKGITAEHRVVKWTYRAVLLATVLVVAFVAVSFVPSVLHFPKDTDTIASIAQAAEETVEQPEEQKQVIFLQLETNNGWCKENKVYVSVEGDLQVEYRYLSDETGEDSGWVSESSKSINENGSWKVQVKDADGNVTEETVTIDNIDTQAPVIRGITEKKKKESQ